MDNCEFYVLFRLVAADAVHTLPPLVEATLRKLWTPLDLFDGRRSPAEAGDASSPPAINDDSVVAFFSPSTLPVETAPGRAADDDVQTASKESASTILCQLVITALRQFAVPPTTADAAINDSKSLQLGTVSCICHANLSCIHTIVMLQFIS